MKHWNMCVQYWLAVNIYKRFPNKKFRTFVTMFISAIWHGVYIGHYFTICGAPFYLPIEDLYVKLFLKDKSSKVCLKNFLGYFSFQLILFFISVHQSLWMDDLGFQNVRILILISSVPSFNCTSSDALL